MVNVEIVYVKSDKSLVHEKCTLSDGATVADALEVSGILVNYPETEGLQLGIFSKRVTTETRLKNGDRIEIYRPLVNDPKDKRRLRAKMTK
ncbi:MAG: RnfH family protein [Legionella sp.]|nr:RnfH family protein [Legionella sp.]